MENSIAGLDCNTEIDRATEIERLAALEPIEYGVVRNDTADRLGVRARILDAEVKKKRRELGLDKSTDESGQGRAVLQKFERHYPTDYQQVMHGLLNYKPPAQLWS